MSATLEPYEAPPTPPGMCSGCEDAPATTTCGVPGHPCELCQQCRLELDGLEETFAIAGDTDGVDGAEEVAGAVIAPDTLTRAQEIGIDPRAFLENNDGHAFFEQLGCQIVTGPTLTNINDFRCIIVGSPDQTL